jgi:hypothetical protein
MLTDQGLEKAHKGIYTVSVVFAVKTFCSCKCFDKIGHFKLHHSIATAMYIVEPWFGMEPYVSSFAQKPLVDASELQLKDTGTAPKYVRIST